MSGGYGTGGGRGTGGGPGGYQGPGYGGADYGDDGTPRADGEPRWDDSVWQRDQPDAWAGQAADPSRGMPQGYDPQGYDPQGYNGQGYNGQGYGGQDYDGPGYAGRDVQGRGGPGSGPSFKQQGPPSGPQRYPRTGPQPVQPGSSAQPIQRSTGSQAVQPGSGPYQGQRGSGPYPAQPGQRGSGSGPRPVLRGSGGMPQLPPGYDQRGTGGHRMANGYDEPTREDQGDAEFLPGFGRRDDFEGGRGRSQDRARDSGRGRDVGRGQGPERTGYDEYNAYDDPRANRGTATDPTRRRDAREQPGRPDQSGRQDRLAPADARRQEGRRPDDRGPNGPNGPNGPDLRPRDGQGNGNGRGNGYDRDDRQPRRRRRSPIRRLAPWIALLVIVVPLALGGWHIYGIWKAKTHPADYVGSGTNPTVTVQVLPNEVAGQLATTLAADGVVASTRAFVLAAENSSNPTGLQPGYFTLNHHMQASLAWAALLNPKNRDQFTVTIPEGKRASQVIATLAKATKIPLKDFEQVIAHPAQLGLPSYANGKVEGFLFPATYPIQPHETALEIVQAMVARYNVAAQQINLTTAAAKVHLTPREVIIEASMAQAEGGSVSDYAKIARVIVNRLKINMALQFDSVLLYGLNKYAINVTYAQIATPGPYNDFKHGGLPPGPISNPGNAAIEGVLNPAPGNWLFFLTVSGGKSEFSLTPLAGQ